MEGTSHMEDQQIDDLRKRVEKLEQEYAELKGQTEPIKVTRIEIDQGGMQELLVQANKQLERIIQTQADRSEKLDTLERSQQELKEVLLQEIHTISNTWLDSLQENVDEIKDDMAGTRADISNIKATQSDHSELLKEHGELLKEHREMLTGLKGDVSSLKGDVSSLKGDVSSLKSDVSSLKGDVSSLKGDVSSLKGDVSSLKTTQVAQDAKLDLILQLLQQKLGE